MLDVIGRVEVKASIENEVKRISSTSLAFAEDGVAESRKIIPERENARLQTIGVKRLLWKEIGIKVSANKSRPDTKATRTGLSSPMRR